MNRLLAVSILVVVLLLVGVATAHAGVGTWSYSTAYKTADGVKGMGRSANQVTDVSIVQDTQYRHWVFGYTWTSTNWADGRGAIKPYWIYAKCKVMYVVWHMYPIGDIYESATDETHNSSPYTSAYVRAPVSDSEFTTTFNVGGEPKYAYTNGTHQFKYNASASTYTWGTYVDIRGPADGKGPYDLPN